MGEQLVENVEDRHVGFDHGDTQTRIEHRLPDGGFVGSESAQEAARGKARSVCVAGRFGSEVSQGERDGRDFVFLCRYPPRPPCGLQRHHGVIEHFRRSDLSLGANGSGEQSGKNVLVLALRARREGQDPIEARETVDGLIAQGRVLAGPPHPEGLDGRIANRDVKAVRLKKNPGTLDRVQPAFSVLMPQGLAPGFERAGQADDGVRFGGGLEFRHETVGANQGKADGETGGETPGQTVG